jgi:hypothetical protein
MKTKKLQNRLSVLKQQEIILEDNTLRWASVCRIFEIIINDIPSKMKNIEERSMTNIRNVYEKEIHELVVIQEEIENINGQLMDQTSFYQNLIKLITRKQKNHEKNKTRII